MARITVSDCVRRVPNRFELVLLAAERARQLGTGDPATITTTNEPRPLVALREIAAGSVAIDRLRERSTARLQRARRDAAEQEEPQEDSFIARFVSSSAANAPAASEPDSDAA